MLGALTFLSPRAAALCIPALIAVAAVSIGYRRADAVRRALRLPPPSPARVRARLALLASVATLLSLAAAQPALTNDSSLRVRRDVQALFVVDISRSMAASARRDSPTRLDRAARAATRLRAAIPGVAAGVATLTDRVLPDLFPVPDRTGFAAVLQRGLAIESPPPQASAVRATSYSALQSIPGGGYFDRHARSRIVVVLTDGESAPVQNVEVADAFAANPGYHVLFIRFWQAGEAIYGADGQAEPAYRPDPSGQATLDSLASALHGNAYGESDVGAAEQRLTQLVGTGPTVRATAGVQRQTALAPYVAALALLAAIALLGLTRGFSSRIRWESS